MDLCACGKVIAQPSTGRRRQKCEECSPKRERPDRKAKRLAVVTPLKPAPAPNPAPVTPPPPAAPPTWEGPGAVESATLEELKAAGREASSLGQEALLLARLLDDGGYTAQGAAALAKARREALEAALKGAKKSASALDDLRNRREAKASGA